MNRFIFYIHIITIFLGAAFLPSFAISAELASAELTQLKSGFSPTAKERRAGAVALLEHAIHKSIGGGKIKTTKHSIIALIDKLAVSDYSTILLSYNKHYSNLNLEYARAISPEGIVTVPSADAIQTISPSQGLIYSNYKQLQFSLPGLKVGSIIEFKYITEQHTSLMEDDWWGNFSLYRSQNVKRQPPFRIDPIRKSKISLLARKNETLNINLVNKHLVSPSQTTRSDGGITYAWVTENLPEIAVEKNAGELSEKMPIVNISSLRSWKDVYDWGADYYQALPVKDIQQLATSITDGITDNQKKIEAIYHYLQKNIRYLSTNFNSNGVVPHSPLQVLDNKYGDCKDQSTLFSSLLRSINIEAYPALINPYGSLEPNLSTPSLNFSHMITYVPSSKSPWIDLTGEDSIFPGMDINYMGRQAFVFNGDNSLKRTSAQTSEDVKIEINIDFDIRDSINKTAIRLIINGAYGNRFGQYYKNLPETELVKLLTSIYPNSTVLSVTSSWTDRAWVVQADLIFPDYMHQNPILVSGGAAQIIYPFRPDLSKAETRNRKTPFVISSPGEMIIKTTISYDASKYTIRQTGPGIDTKMDSFNISISDNITSSYYQKIIRVKVHPNTYSAEEYKTLADKVSQAAKSSIWTVSLDLKRNDQDENTDVNKSAYTVNSEFSSILNIRKRIERSEYDTALKAITEFIHTNQNNGEAYYVKGLVLGFMDKYAESDLAFEKAETLGYTE